MSRRRYCIRFEGHEWPRATKGISRPTFRALAAERCVVVGVYQKAACLRRLNFSMLDRDDSTFVTLGFSRLGGGVGKLAWALNVEC